MKKRIVIKLGGSLLFNKNFSINNSFLKNIGDIFKLSEDIVAIITGGGLIARNYINSAREFEADEASCDEFGIKVSRLNAQLIQTALGDICYPKVLTNLEEIRECALWNKIIVSGGFIPGQSTTSVTFEIAEALKATDVIILTDVEGIFDKDPNKYPNAKKFDKISISELEEVIYSKGGKNQAAAGEYRIFDAVSIQIFKRSHFKVRLANGKNFKSLRDLLIQKMFDNPIGTKIENL